MGTVRRLRWFVLAFIPAVYAEPLPPAVVHQPYHHQLPVAGTLGCAGFQPLFQVAGGELPAGVRLESDGRLTGEPQRIESGALSVRVSTPCSERTSDWTWTVRGAPLLFVEPAEVVLDSSTSRATVLVSSSWPGLAYSLTTTDGSPLPPWLRAKPRRGRTPREGSALTGDRVELTVDASLAPPDAAVKLLVHAWGGKEPAALNVRFGPPSGQNP